MPFKNIQNIYFLGIGGIGMSSLARYFHQLGKKVGGYDRTPTPLTQELLDLGILIHFNDRVQEVPESFLNKENTLVVRTPAVPQEHSEFGYFKKNGFQIMKRAEVLGLLFNSQKGIGIAGTHGKTSVSTFTSYLMQACGLEPGAFLGGMAKNFNSNLLTGNSGYVIAEADEFDRSFLQLNPYISLVTTVDADHMDIYKDYNDIANAFSEFLSHTHNDGTIILNQNVHIKIPESVDVLTYALDSPESDIYASEIKVEENAYTFTVNTPKKSLSGFRLQVPGKTNIENTMAAISVCYTLGVPLEKIREVLPGMQGVVRRFDVQLQTKDVVYIDDYAHHPRELDAVIASIQELYPGKKLTGIFQPHLYTRTRDFADDFAISLSKLDELILLDIYPAREKPLPGVSSEMLYKKVKLEEKHHCSKENLLDKLKSLNIEVLLTLGAGDIDQWVGPIKQQLMQYAKI